MPFNRPPLKSLIDRAIADMLKDEAIISRRTVAKYRSALGLLSSSKRASS